MKRLHFIKPNNLSRLHDQLLAAIPALRPVRTGRPESSGERDSITGAVLREFEPVMGVQGRGDNIWLEVPDTVDEAAIAAVVAAHDSAIVPPPTPAQTSAARLGELLAIPRSDWTTAQQREILQLVAQALPH